MLAPSFKIKKNDKASEELGAAMFLIDAYNKELESIVVNAGDKGAYSRCFQHLVARVVAGLKTQQDTIKQAFS